jgi:hypothetical protein
MMLIRNIGNTSPLRGATCVKKQATFRLIFAIYTAVPYSYSVQAMPLRVTQLSAIKN